MTFVKTKALKFSTIKRFLTQNSILWLALWLFSVLNNYQVFAANNRPFSWVLFFSWSTPYYFIMFGAGPLIYLLYHARSQNSYASQFVSHLSGAILLSFIQQLGLNLYIVLTDPMQVYEADVSLLSRLQHTYEVGLLFSVTGFLFYFLGLGFVLFLDIYDRFRQKEKANYTLETALSKARFDTLQSQLQPHFLFNTFNSLSMMARQQKHEEVVDMIAKVSTLLRETLSLEDQRQVTLEREIELVGNYLSIEQVRFRDRLTVSIEMADDAKSHSVPVLFMQPLVENAFIHGISKTEGDAELVIRAKLAEEALIIEIINSGPALPADWDLDENMGIGINNVLQRLDHAHRASYEFSIANRSTENGVITSIKLPL